VLQCAAVCCSVSVCYSMLQCVAVCCSVLQCVAVCVAVCCSVHTPVPQRLPQTQLLRPETEPDDFRHCQQKKISKVRAMVI